MAVPNGTPLGGAANRNYCAYKDPALHIERIGLLDFDRKTIQPVAFESGTPVENLYQVIEAGVETSVVPRGEAFPLSYVELLAPISGRDVLAIGKNYSEHAAEFNKSGYDSSDKTDQPSHPVFFTKRATSIVADGAEMYFHPGFSDTIDYEGEIGVIIGKSGFRISEQDAMNYVWGYTIINDMTARERQRDHKQFFIGKSPDTFCPMGPVAVPKEHLPKVLRVQTHVNGQLRQDSTTESLIFSIPFLIKTFSEGSTIQPGDVIATGTPAGVGFGLDPPKFLDPGDEVTVTVTGLGVLRNKIGPKDGVNSAAKRGLLRSHLPLTNRTRSQGVSLTTINSKPLYYRHIGKGTNSIVFVHGLGGTMDFYTPVIQSLRLEEDYNLHLFDLEGHGLSPTSPLSKLSIESFSQDVLGIFKHAKLGVNSPATLVAHSLGCLIALRFASQYPELVRKLVLLGPPPSPLPEAGSKGAFARAETVRSGGMPAVVDAVATAGTSEATKARNHVALTAVRLSLLGQDPEAYAKACMALGGATSSIEVENIKASTLIITGEEDKVSPPMICEKYASRLKYAPLPVVLKDVGHWHIFEDTKAVSDAIGAFLKKEWSRSSLHIYIR